MMNDRFSYDGWDEREAYLGEEKGIDWSDPYSYNEDVVEYPVIFHDNGYGKYLETSHNGLYGVRIKDEYILTPLEIHMREIYSNEMNQYNRAINSFLWITDPLMKHNNCRDVITGFIDENREYLRQCIRLIPVYGDRKRYFGNEVHSLVSYNIQEVERFITLQTNSVLLDKCLDSKSISIISFVDRYSAKSTMKDIRTEWKWYDPFKVYTEFNENVSKYIQIINRSEIVDNIILKECGNIRKNMSRKYDDTIKGVRSNTYKFQYTHDCTMANLLSLLVIAKRVQQMVSCWSVTLTIQIDDIQYILHNIGLYYDLQCKRYDQKLNKTECELHFNGINQLMYLFWYISNNAPSLFTLEPVKPMLVNFSWNKRPMRCFK